MSKISWKEKIIYEKVLMYVGRSVYDGGRIGGLGGLYNHQGGIFLNSCFNIFINIGCMKDHLLVWVHLIEYHQHH